MNRTRLSAAALALLLGIGLVACSSNKPSASGSTKGAELVGLFRLTPGAVNGTAVAGTWFRMLQPGGNAKSGPYMTNADSPADNGQATLLAPGSSGGLRTDGYQSEPAIGFAASGDSLANAITMPTKFFGVKFSISTNPVDPQTKTKVPPPTVVLDGTKLRADLSSWAASWNNQEFNQGSPKPVSSTGAKALGQAQAERTWDWVAHKYLEAAPKSTVTGNDATGTYNPTTHAFVLEWTSYIQGGPFNGFTGLWHLEGTYEKSGRAPSDQ